MAVKGPAKQDQKTGRYQNVTDWYNIPDRPYDGPVPNVPWTYEDPFLAQWWEKLTRMPHCILWNESDWQYAVDTALLKRRFYEPEKELNAALLTELRRREEAMGMTLDSRQKLRIRYVPIPVDEQKRENAKVLKLATPSDDMEHLFDE